MTLTHTGSEWNLLLSLCQMAISPSKQLPTIDWKDVDWEKLLQLARRHQVQPLAYQALNQYQGVIPTKLVARLKQHSTFVTTRNLHHIKGVLKLSEVLKEVSWFPFKGIILSKMAYGNLSTRSSSDIDILIRKEDYYKVKSTLLAAGFSCPKLPVSIENKLLKYNCENKFEYFQNGKQIYNIDVHWYIGNRALQLNYGFSDFAPWIQKNAFHGKEMLLMTPEALLFNTCLHHGGKEYWWSLKYLADVAAIIKTYQQQFDWQQLIKIAKDKGILKIIFIGLYLAQNLLAAPLPKIAQKVIEEEQISKAAERHLEALKNPLPQNLKFQLFFKRMFLHLNTRSGWKTKLKIIYFHGLQLLTPSPNDMTSEKAMTTIEYLQVMLNKPFRIWKQYIRLDKIAK